MTTLSELISGDITGFLLDDEEGAEEITYTPDGGAPTAIKAFVRRFDPQRQDDSGEGAETFWDIEVHISTDATHGIASPGIKDTVAVGGKTYRMEDPPNADPLSETAKLRMVAVTDQAFMEPGVRRELRR